MPESPSPAHSGQSQTGGGSNAEYAPQRYGKYTLIQRIGAGGMAEVFHAIATGPEGFQRSLVVKRMLPHLCADPAFVRMFIDEAKVSALLSHPNLVQIYEFGRIEDTFFIAMEYVHGKTLSAINAALTNASRTMPVAASVEIARQVCRGLQYAHSLHASDGKSLGIVHRDISPPNLIVDFHGPVKILDFGIARVADEIRDSRTQVGTLKGKVSYMAPEQLTLADVDHRADIFAVGIVLHELLTGKRLFRSPGGDQSSGRMVLEAPIPLPSSLNPDVPEAVDQVVMRALTRDRDARYSSAGEMANNLDQVMVEMKLPPNDHLKLLDELFPGESTEKNLSTTGSFSNPNAPLPGDDVDLDVVTAPGRGLGYDRRRTLLRVGALAVVLTGVLFFVLRRGHHTVQPSQPSALPPAAVAIEPAAKSVHLSIDSTPQDALVFRIGSDEALGRTPMFVLQPASGDSIEFRFEKPGYLPATHKIIPDMDKSLLVNLELVRAPASAPAPTAMPAPGPARGPLKGRGKRGPAVAAAGRLGHAPATAGPAPGQCFVTVGSAPWAEVWIDGKDTGQPTPAVRLPVACGSHKLRLKREEMEIDEAMTIEVAPDHEFKHYYHLKTDD
jgi:serine/threonine-protein kinase